MLSVAAVFSALTSQNVCCGKRSIAVKLLERLIRHTYHVTSCYLPRCPCISQSASQVTQKQHLFINDTHNCGHKNREQKVWKVCPRQFSVCVDKLL